MVTLTLLDPQKKTPLHQWKFDTDPVIRIGRSPDNQIVLNNPLVSRYHLELRQSGNLGQQHLWQLINKGTNGTFVNDVLMSQGLVTDGCLIQLGWGGPLLQFTQQPAGSLGISSPLPPINQGGIVPNQGHPPPSPKIQNPGLCNYCGNVNLPQNLFCLQCGQPLNVQRTIRNYQVLRILGQGGMGTTYLAWDRERAIAKIPAIVVLKEMNADMAKIAKARELFEREARILQNIRHPGIPQYYDFFVEGGKKYLAMEMVHGQDLEKRVITTGPVILAQAIAWMCQTCEVLEYIHSQTPPIIHRDIKPANLLVRNLDNRVIVLDFGAVKEIGTPSGTRIGAPDYSPVEQEQGQPLTQSDLYAIGPTLIFLLTGKSPSNFYKPRGAEYRFNVENVPTITPKVREVIERVTEPRPRDRYQTAQELAQALSACL